MTRSLSNTTTYVCLYIPKAKAESLFGSRLMLHTLSRRIAVMRISKPIPL